MLYLLAASLLFAPSFGLIRHILPAQEVDPSFVAWARMLICCVAFAPFVRLRGLRAGLALRLLALGAVQYGLMYVAYIHSFRYLAAHQVALFTILTPLHVTLLNDLQEREFHARFLSAALVAVAGTAVIVAGKDIGGALTGFLLVQASNVCFAAGQIGYRRVMDRGRGREAASGAWCQVSGERAERKGWFESPAASAPAVRSVRDRDVFGLMYAGALLLTTVAAAATRGWSGLHLTRTQTLTLVYLGVVPSGLGFFLWNVGARKVNAGTLAVFNNAKIPIAIAASIVLFHEAANLPRLIGGGAVIAVALFLNERRSAQATG